MGIGVLVLLAGYRNCCYKPQIHHMKTPKRGRDEEVRMFTSFRSYRPGPKSH